MTAPTETASPKTARKGSTQGPRGLAAVQAARGGLNDGTRRSSEDARAWDEKQYRDLFERAVEGVFRTTASGRALSINLAGARMLGYDSPEEVLVAAMGDAGATWIDPARRAELVERVRTAGAVSDFEYEVHRRDGSTAWLSIHARAAWDADVPELCIEGLIVDVTRRRDAEQALIESRDRYRSLYEHMLEGVTSCRMLFDEAGQPIDWIYLDVNPAFEELTGLADVTGKRVTEVIPGVRETNPELFEIYGRVTATGVPEKFETYLPILERWFSVSASRPRPDHFAAILENITERKRVAEDLRESEQQYRAVVDHLTEGVVVQDAAGRIVASNPAARAILGLTLDEFTGRTSFDPEWHAVWADGTPTRGEVHPATIARTTGLPATGVVMGVRHSSGATRWLLVNAQPLRDASGDELTGVVVSFSDITERERLARERERLAAIVEESADGIVITDADGRLSYANPAFVATIGRGLPDLIGKAMADVMLDVLDPATIADVERTITAGRRWVGAVDRRVGAVDRRVGAADRRVGSVDRRGTDGTMRHVEVSVTPRRGPDGAVSSYVSVTRDVTELREAEAELALEARVRAAMTESLHNIPADATLEQAAHGICDELVKLPFIDMASIQVFLDADDVQIIALSAPAGYPTRAGEHLPPAIASLMQERVAKGPWAGYATEDVADEGWVAGRAAAGLKALAYGPIGHGDHVEGVLVIGTFDERFARALVEKMPALVSFSATSSALLAERMHTMRREADLHAALTAVLAATTFHPVFQPIVELESGGVVGYEALTRFDSDQRPDLCFADAWSVGLGPELEIATLEAAVAAAKGLPPGLWLDLNVSPRLLEDGDRLRESLSSADRPIVLEITEHDHIEDYDAVREAVRALGRDIRLAVDDAGAGVANFGHIIDLRPDFVKLDISLVRRVNVNLERQAMVVGMRHFARTAGCRLIAEGIETEEEARTLTALGVEFGQGYLFGHPEPVELWAAAAPGEQTEREVVR
jgi:PAS domain S-box-containing protein